LRGRAAGGARERAGGVVERDALVVLEDEEHGALDADLLGVRGRQSVEGVLGVGAERAEPPCQVRLSVLQPPQVGGELGEVASGSLVVALGLRFQWSCFAFGQPRPEDLDGGIGIGHDVPLSLMQETDVSRWSMRAGNREPFERVGAFAQSGPVPT
jgi:hypothetical protein